MCCGLTLAGVATLATVGPSESAKGGAPPFVFASSYPFTSDPFSSASSVSDFAVNRSARYL